MWRFEAPNPITEYAVGLEFAGFLSSDKIVEISAQHPQVRKELPRRIQQQGVVLPQLQFAMPGLAIPGMMMPGFPGQPSITGVTFDRLKPDGATDSSLAVNPLSMNYNVANYSRWDEFWPLAARIMAMITSISLPAVGINGLRLQANNRFLGTESSDLHDLLKISDFLPSHILSQRPSCHFSMGWPSRSELPLPGSLVQNVTLAVNQQPDNTVFADLNFNFRLTLDTPVIDPETFAIRGARASPAADTFFHLHQTNNMLFKSILIDAITSPIRGLEPC